GARPDEAEDALHDAFEKALTRRDEIVRPEGWLFVVGLRRWRSHRIRSAIFAPLSLLRRTTEMDGEGAELLSEMRRFRHASGRCLLRDIWSASLRTRPRPRSGSRAG